MKSSMRSLLMLLSFTVVLASIAGAQDGRSHASCTPKFPLKDAWLGADVGSSVPLPDGRVFWIFGDTLYGEKRVVNGNDPVMTRSSVGISTCKDGKWDIKYIIRRGKDGKEADYFKARVPNTWYWALNGAYYNGELWVTLLCVRGASNEPLGFAGCGADLARITGVQERDPQKWKIEYMELVPDGVKSFPTAAAVFEKDFLYIYSLNDFGDRSQVITRIPVAGLRDVRKNLQYLSNDDTWKSGFDPQTAKAVMPKGSSEFTVKYHPELKKWVAVMFAPEWMSNKVIFRTANDLIGPWSEGQTIFEVPEMQKEAAGYDVDNFCYAAKEHPEFEKQGELVFTYVCNSMKPPKVVNLTNIYFPQTVRREMPVVK